MKDLSSCFGEHSIKLSPNSAGAAGDCGSLTTVTSFFKATLSSGNAFIIKLFWSTNQSESESSLSIGVDDSPASNNPSKTRSFSMKSQLLREKKGAHSFLTGASSVSLHWDFSAARYIASPEPTENFFVAVIINSQIALLLGDQSGDFMTSENLPMAESSLLCRREEVSIHSLNSTTRVKFGEHGKHHEISIRCREAELLVSIDKREVVQVGKLKWNFRGSETVFVDGLPVDMMWDMHGWWFGSLAGYAVFLFRQRRKLQSRLWLEEEETLGFSLVIRAFKSTC